MAAGRDMHARLLLTLRDGISSGLGRLQRQLSAIAGMSRRIGAVGAALAAISFAGPVQAAANFQDVLLQTQITAGGVGAAAHAAAAEAGLAWQRLALETGQRSAEIARGASNLAASGLGDADITRFMPIIARAATATGASIEDLSRTAIALRQNLNITSAEGMERTLARLAQAGKLGMFELRDMAREFPTLTAAVNGLGIAGEEAANSLGVMLQIARRGAGSTSEAANNLANFLQKITAPETVERFRDVGVDLRALLADAARQGINPIEAVIQKIREVTGGDMFRVGQLFGDAEVLRFLRPMLSGTRDYLEMLEGVRRANASLLDQDFATRQAGAFIQLQLVSERLGQLMTRIGTAASAGLAPLNDMLAAVQRGIHWIDTNYPGVIDQTLLWVAGVTLLAGALGVLMPVLGAISAGIALLFSPIVLLTAALVGAAYIIWSNWAEFAPFFQRLWDGVKTIFMGAVNFVQGLVRGDWLTVYQSLTYIWSGLGAAFGASWDIVRGVFRQFVKWVDGWSGGAMSQGIAAIMAPWNALTGFFDTLWNGIQTRFDSFVTHIRDTFAPVAAIIERVQGGFRSGQEAQAQREAQAPVLGRVRGSANAAQPFDENGNRIPSDGARPAPVSGSNAGSVRADVSGRFQFDLAPGLVLRSAETTAPGLAIAGSQGPVLARP